jgi:hypothetical protein
VLVQQLVGGQVQPRKARTLLQEVQEAVPRRVEGGRLLQPVVQEEVPRQVEKEPRYVEKEQ